MSLGNVLRDERMRKNITQEKLAEIMNVSRQTVSRWELDEAYPQVEKLKSLSKLFDIPVDTLLFGYTKKKKLTEMESDENDKNISEEISIKNIVVSVIYYYGLNIEDFMAGKRTKEYIRGREISIYLCDKLTEHSKSKIAEIHNCEFATVIATLQRAKIKKSSDAEQRAEWNRILECLKNNMQLSQISYNAWIKPLKLFAVKNNTIQILITQKTAYEYIFKNFKQAILDAILQVTGMEYELEFVFKNIVE